MLDPVIKFVESDKLSLPASFTPGIVYYESAIEIHTPSYRHNKKIGFCKNEKLAFKRDAQLFAESIGFESDSFIPGLRCFFSNHNYESMHIHPDQITGNFLPETLSVIAEALSHFQGQFKGFPEIRVSRIYERPSPEEVIHRLNTYKKEIKAFLMNDYSRFPGSFFEPAAGVSMLPLFSHLPGLLLIVRSDLDTTINQVFSSFRQELVSDGLLSLDCRGRVSATIKKVA